MIFAGPCRSDTALSLSAHVICQRAKVSLANAYKDSAELGGLSILVRSAFPNRDRTLILMLGNTALTQAGAAGKTIELVSMANVVPAFTALYSPIDVLKHCHSNDRRKTLAESR